MISALRASIGRIASGPRWIAATGVGFAFGFALWQVLFPFVRSALSQTLAGSLNAALFGVVVGVLVGAAQWVAFGGRLGPAARWVAASVVGYGVGFVAAAWAAALLTNALGGRVSVALSDGSEVLAFGLLIGAGVGMARGLASRRSVASAGIGALLSGTSYAVGYAATYGLSQLAAPTSQPWLGAAFGLCAGVLAASLEWTLFGWAGFQPGMMTPGARLGAGGGSRSA